jgi:hypothetical protein
MPRKGDSVELLTDELQQVLPSLYAQEGNDNPMVYAKFFTPDSSWTWYVTEGSPENCGFIFFGYVVGQEREWGYFSLENLRSIRGPIGLSVERDLHFTPRRFSDTDAGKK